MLPSAAFHSYYSSFSDGSPYETLLGLFVLLVTIMLAFLVGVAAAAATVSPSSSLTTTASTTMSSPFLPKAQRLWGLTALAAAPPQTPPPPPPEAEQVEGLADLSRSTETNGRIAPEGNDANDPNIIDGGDDNDEDGRPGRRILLRALSKVPFPPVSMPMDWKVVAESLPSKRLRRRFGGRSNDEEEITEEAGEEVTEDLSDREIKDSNGAEEETETEALADAGAEVDATAPTVIHFCFLVHGHRGLSRDLSYLQSALTDVARQKLREQRLQSQQQRQRQSLMHEAEVDLIGDENSDEAVGSSSGNRSSPSRPRLQHDVVVYNAMCNEGRTHDGISTGGDRLVEEMLDRIRSEVADRRKTRRDALVRQRRANEGEQLLKPPGESESLPSKTAKERLDELLELEADADVVSSEISNLQSAKVGDDFGEEEEMIDVTLSVVGNSLGGMYARYAVARLAERFPSASSSDRQNDHDGSDDGCDDDSSSDSSNSNVFIVDGTIRVHYNVFCTTATPHLGVAGHTYLPIPRIGEIGVGHLLGSTGRDLFRLNDLLHTMATSPRFLEPLGSFRKRIAYANAYKTDFPVPAETAAFLCQDSRYPHHFVDEGEVVRNKNDDSGEEEEEEEDYVMEKNGLIVATLHTAPVVRSRSKSRLGTGSNGVNSGASSVNAASASVNPLQVPMEMQKDEDETTTTKTTTMAENDNNDNDSDLTEMSMSLDSLGWKKVFVDIRGEIPINVSIPPLLRKVGSSSFGGGDDSDVDGDENAGGGDSPVQTLRRRRVIGSRDVVSAFSSLPADNKISLPIGHNMICAFSRDRVSARLNRGGRPVMDNLARELVNDILMWDEVE